MQESWSLDAKAVSIVLRLQEGCGRVVYTNEKIVEELVEFRRISTVSIFFMNRRSQIK
jgi:hypothetical protein